MEYLIGSLLTLFIIVAVNKWIKRPNIEKDIFVRYSQSHIHELIHGLLPDNTDMAKVLVTQSSKHYDQTHIRIIITQGKAYWIKENKFYVADVVGGEIDQSTAKEVDIMSMDKVQLNKMMFIVEKLTEGTTNDYWNAG